ncbi:MULTISPECIES: hypothetical protein [unclassified Novosphingobium]|uniref:hypothetical protein n=1 Tax=unclassified Novosphingobium TaxID=2644732 RepID=UPI000D2FF83D|nr:MULTISPECIES: hypothetical protein [unclassified Novosphingobium]PTR06968.1 hypothetical protein C8K11_11720 [Novosphingobium sp. GV055]PUA99880.1 hypothetical protein C8K12_11773 [Novosphingobium sp. GV061]PUB14710.1 hypothetical protein C8K14_11720 [Novosphingobium sp. GV079]PUB38944.1 hypothetical protein C8K10_11773 [Novosphingobium sp. GV027]
MCSTPTVPTTPERQTLKLPDQGAPAGAMDTARWRRAILAGMVTSPLGLTGSARISSTTLGSGGTLG